ncbi:MAG: hypothetical protein DRQ59_13410 [Gammaproteobacteria bacterium]|nr:MAG: hypothetical protein DRQ59_13410 [Gammaproteobacteria bacterium]
MTADKQESRMSRWSRRKQQSAEATREEDLALQLEEQNLAEVDIPGAVTDQDQQETEAEEPVLTDEDMPAIESLTEDSNFGQFMSSGVSDELRNLALRKMYKAPFFNIRDGLDEYDEDYTSFEKLGDIVTADMRHQMEIEARKKLEAEAKEIAEAASNADAHAEDDKMSIDDQQALPADAHDKDIEDLNEEPDDQSTEIKIENSIESRVPNQ